MHIFVQQRAAAGPAVCRVRCAAVRIDGECDVTVDRWSALDADQYFLNDEDKVCAASLCNCEQNTVLALEDRNSLANEWPPPARCMATCKSRPKTRRSSRLEHSLFAAFNTD